MVGKDALLLTMLEISEKNSSAAGNLWYNINCVKKDLSSLLPDEKLAGNAVGETRPQESKSITDRSSDTAAENKEK